MIIDFATTMIYNTRPIIIGTYSLLLIFSLPSCHTSEKNPSTSPAVLDPHLELELIAEQPTVMTPIGITIDSEDNLYILESHTHSPPSDYQGPKFDRIKKGIDKDKDGKPDVWTVYADSIEDGMNLTFDEGKIYLCTKNSGHVYEDTNDDGVSDVKRDLFHMVQPNYVYDHAGILGIAVSDDGWVYISRGNTGSQYWVVRAANGETIEGYGDGGNVFRLQQDGTQVEEVATGFWNPFDIKFSAEGRLLLTDNDPDSRGPNRLIEVVPGGDYGYQSLYGGSGLHPYLAWNGELPGTLPYAAALGEAPCALIDASYSNFGPDYQNNMLVNVWEENNIVRIPLEQKGSTVVGQSEVIVQGDSSFHPVGFAANSHGDIYLTDWVVRQYPNHGHGKIWRLSAKRPASVSPQPATVNRFDKPLQNTEELFNWLQPDDEFQRAMARKVLANEAFKEDLLSALDDEVDDRRLEALLVFLKSDMELDKGRLVALLNDENKDVQRMAMIYTGKHFRKDVYAELQDLLSSGKISANLFETYLATVQHLQPDFIQDYHNKAETSSNKLEQKLPESFIESLISDVRIPGSVRALGLPYLQAAYTLQDRLIALLGQAANQDFMMGLLAALKPFSSEASTQASLRIALDEEVDEQARGQALLTLEYKSEDYCEEIIPLLKESSHVIQRAALAYLKRCGDEPAVMDAIDDIIHEQNDAYLSEAWQSYIHYREEKDANIEEWANAVNGQGDVFQGKLVFESKAAQCQTCHKVNGWGGIFGPDLSNVGKSKSREKLVKAILYPSEEISPDWQGWYVIDQDGKKHYGRQIDVHLHSVELMNEEGVFEGFEEPLQFGVSESSLMPEGLYRNMTPVEFNDLIAYLESL